MSAASASKPRVPLARAAAACLAASTFSVVPHALAQGDLDPKQTCIAAADTGQRLRDEGTLLAAKEQFTACAATGCPDVIREACAEWLDEVVSRTPSVVLVVVDETGRDLVPEWVEIDERREPALAGGRALPVDPGAHHIVVAVEGYAISETDVVLRTGEKDRQVRLVANPVQGSAPDAGAGRDRSRVSWVPVLGATGLAFIGGSVALGLVAREERAKLEGQCAPGCTDAELRPTRTKLWVGEAFLSVGVVSVGTAGWLWLRGRRHDEAKRSAVAPRFELEVAPRGLVFEATF